MTNEDLSFTDLAFLVSAAGFAIACSINIMAGAQYLGLMYAVLAMVLATYVQVDRTRRETRGLRELLKQWPPLPRSNDTTAAELPNGVDPTNRRY